MTKKEFLLALKKKISSLPKKDIEERINFYSEIIDDKIEEGCPEDKAVAEIGSVEEIACQILSEALQIKPTEKSNSKRRFQAWEITLLVLGSPIWLSLIIALFSVILSVYVSIWAVVISIWAAFVAITACSVAGILCGIVFLYQGNFISSIAIFGISIVCMGLAIFFFCTCKHLTVKIYKLTKKMTLWIKKLFVKGEKV